MSMISARHPLLRIALAATVLVGLTALSMPTTLQRQGPEVAPTYTFVDARPAQQMESGVESLLISNCAYGSTRIGDRDFTPGLAAILNDRLMMRFADALRGRTVRLVNFTVHINDSVGLRRLARMSTGYFEFGGVCLGGSPNRDVTVGCAADDLRGGFTLAELPLDAQAEAPWIVVVDIEIDGRPYHARHAGWSDPKRGVLKGANREETRALRRAGHDAEVARVVDAALDRLVDSIAVSMPPGAAPSP